MRVQATMWFTPREVLRELDALKFAASALCDLVPRGSCERENAENAVRGIGHRIDYLHDSLKQLPEFNSGASHD